MNLSGRTIVIGIFVLAFVMAGGAWWHRWNESRHAAAFWGKEGVPLVTSGKEVTFYALGRPGDDGETIDAIPDRPVRQEFDLSDKRGLVHLRYALTQDANFQWDKLRAAPRDDSNDWAYAIDFSDGQRSLIIVLDRSLELLGLLRAGSHNTNVVPCPRLAPAIQRYLTEIGAPLAPDLAPGH
jgi:hypothetical protein